MVPSPVRKVPARTDARASSLRTPAYQRAAGNPAASTALMQTHSQAKLALGDVTRVWSSIAGQITRWLWAAKTSRIGAWR
jgi:hypothetical protein